MTAIQNIPQTTDAKCAEYKTTCTSCECGDFKSRNGGRYNYRHVKTCKHRVHVILKAYKRFDYHLTSLAHPEANNQPFCLCPEFDCFGARTCQHLRLLKQLEGMFALARKVDLSAAERSPQDAINALYGKVAA